ncbi:MAG: DUF4124 domain-containing protein [Pseudomonadota bacterium]
MRLSPLPTFLACLLLLLALAGQAQPVFKWVDAQGKTHYGQQPTPDDKAGEALKLQSNTGFVGDNNDKARTVEYNADGTRKIPKDVQDLARGFEKAFKKTDPKTVPLDCNAAVDNAQYQGDMALEVSAKNLKGGYITLADYDNNATNIRRAKATTTVGHCLASTGKERAFYQCMSNGNNHFLACTQK